jgi:hypothetical protein
MQFGHRSRRLSEMDTRRQVGIALAGGGFILLMLMQQRTMALEGVCRVPLEGCWRQYQLYSFLRLVGGGVGTLGLVIAAVPEQTVPSVRLFDQQNSANSRSRSRQGEHKTECCMTCGAKQHPSHSYCYQCGVETRWSATTKRESRTNTNTAYERTDTFCAVCGVPVHDTCAYCVNCGSQLTRMIRSQEPVYPRPKNPPSMKVAPSGICTGCGARNRGTNGECIQCKATFDMDVQNKPLLNGG